MLRLLTGSNGQRTWTVCDLHGFYEPVGTTAEPVGSRVLVDSMVIGGHTVHIYSYVAREVGPGIRETGLLIEVPTCELARAGTPLQDCPSPICAGRRGLPTEDLVLSRGQVAV